MYIFTRIYSYSLTHIHHMHTHFSRTFILVTGTGSDLNLTAIRLAEEVPWKELSYSCNIIMCRGAFSLNGL